MIPHPVYPSAAARADDGQTMLALGVIRPYKGLADAVEVVRRLPDARLLVAGDPAMPLDELRDAPRTEWRLGYLAAVRARPGALATRRSRSSPTAPSSTSRARCCRRSAPACRRSPTTSAGSPSRSRATAPGASSPAGDVEALTEAARELLGDRAALAARARGRRAGTRGADVGRGRRRSTSRSTGSSRDLPPRRASAT